MEHKRKRVLIVAATSGYQTRMFADAAARIGVEAIMATDRCHVLPDPYDEDSVPLRFENPEGAAQLLSTLEPRPDAIVAVGDRPASIAALAAARLNLPFHTPDAIAATRSKFLARERFRAAGLLVPAYRRFRLKDNPATSEVKFPCVLKPLCLSGSRGVIRADTRTEFTAAFQRIRALLSLPELVRLRDEPSDWIQVEDFIPGREYALEGVMTHGALRTLTVFDKPDPLDGPFFEETIYTSPSTALPELRKEMQSVTDQAVRALGLTHGPIHAEMRCNQRGVWMLEVAARSIGGLCAKTLRFTDGRFDEGMPLEELVLRHALGETVDGLELQPGASGVMMIPIPKSGIYARATGLDKALGIPDIHEVTITAKQGQRLLRLPEGNSYLGFIFARAGTVDAVDCALRAAHARLDFEIQTELT